VLNGDYYLSRSLFLYTASDPTPVVAGFLRWILDPLHGQAIAREIGFYELTSEMIEEELSKLPPV
jgi:ABC-type phosphate transport system substrate-binding protein